MNAKNRIKIVKRGERASSSGEAEAAEVKSQAPLPNVTQKVSRQVAAWVREFQQRQIQERGQNFDSLFQRA